jgi:hypothetical protein
MSEPQTRKLKVPAVVERSVSWLGRIGEYLSTKKDDKISSPCPQGPCCRREGHVEQNLRCHRSLRKVKLVRCWYWRVKRHLCICPLRDLLHVLNSHRCRMLPVSAVLCMQILDRLERSVHHSRVARVAFVELVCGVKAPALLPEAITISGVPIVSSLALHSKL